MVDALLVTRIFAPEPAAASYRLSAFARVWSAEGRGLTVLTTRPPGVRPSEESAYRVSRWPVKRAADGAVRGYLSYMSFDVPAFFRALVAPRPDVIVAEPPPTTGVVMALVSWMRRIPFVYYAADCWSDATAATDAPTAVVRAVRTFERFAMRRASVVLTVNAAIAARLREIEPSAHIEDVGNGVDTAVFAHEGKAADVEGPTVVYTGTASEWQGADVFVEAWPYVREHVPGARLRFIGGGSAWPSLRARAEELKLSGSAEFLDTVPPHEAAAHLRAAALAVVSLRPGIADYALPTKLLAATACGTRSLYVGEGVGERFTKRVSMEFPGASSAVAFDPTEVARRIVEVLRMPRPAAERAALAAWAQDNVSLDAVAARAGAVVVRAVERDVGCS